MYPATCIRFTNSSPQPVRSIDILKMNTLPFDCLGKWLPCTNLKTKRSLSAMILSMMSIPLQTNRFESETKLHNSEKPKLWICPLQLPMMHPEDDGPHLENEIWEGNLQRITKTKLFAIGVFITLLTTQLYAMIKDSPHVLLETSWSCIPRWMQAHDILGKFKWTYIYK